MKKLTLKMVISGIASALILGSSSVNAATPNTWSSSYWQGWLEVSTFNPQGQVLRIACNDGAEKTSDHSVTFIDRGNREYSVNDNGVSIAVDGLVFDSLESESRIGGMNWDGFMDSMSKARKINIYINKALVATFNPKQKYDFDCQSLWNRSE